MIEAFVETKNTVRLNQMYAALNRRERGVPGFGLVHGATGLGKTTAVARMASAANAIYIRCESLWTPTALCEAICEGVGLPPGRDPRRMLKDIKVRSIANPRALVVDEADYLFGQPKLLDVLRDLTDSVNIPIVLVGMDGIERKVLRHPQHARRMLVSVEFQSLDPEDFGKSIDRLSEVAIAPCLKDYALEKTKGSIGLTIVAIPQFEKFWLGCEGELTLEAWLDAGKQLFLGACV